MLDVGGTRVLARAGLLAPTRPDRLLGVALALARWGLTPATGWAAGAARHPTRAALVDDDGVLTWRQVDRRSDRAAAALRARGVVEGTVVGLLARNGRGFVEAVAALAKCGADVLYLGPGWAPAQTAAVLAAQGARVLVRDPDLPAAPGVLDVTTADLADWAVDGTAPPVLRSSRAGRQVLLTSGTTGTPRGAARSSVGVADAVAALDRLPLRAGGTTLVAAPAFHAWGLGHLSLALVLGSTLVLHRTFDPEQVLASVEEHRVDALVLVPVMLERLLAARPERFDTSSLRLVASSGSALPASLPARTEAAFGPVLHSLYGSTEVAVAAVAGPDDLRADPRTAGRPPHGVRLRVLGDDGRDVPPGRPGRVFVGSGLVFGGYTDGSDKDRVDGLVATGDLGTLDAAGRLRVLGREDDMVVVGGENVFTGAVEDALATHPLVVEAAVVAEPDEQYGSRLVAHVVACGPVDAEELQEHVRGRLARWAAPREVRVVPALPRNETGKVLKRELRA